MRVSDKAIVLHNIRYGDKKSILKLYTKHYGCITVSAFVSNSPGSKIKPATVLPLSLIDAAFVLKQNKEMQQLNETSCYYVNSRFSLQIEKLAIAQFINEILLKTLKEQSANEHLFEFIETCIKYLNDSDNEFMNLHVYFLIELSKYLGFEPQNNYSEHMCYFDCREGRFGEMSLSMPLGLSSADSRLFSEALKCNPLKVNMSHTQRQLLLDILLAYYQLHIPSFHEIRSLEVLRDVFSEQKRQ